MVKQPAKVNFFFGAAYKFLYRTIFGSFRKSFILIRDSAAAFFRALKFFISSFIALVASIFQLDFEEIWDCTKDSVRSLFVLTYAFPLFLCATIVAPSLTLF